MLMVNLAQTVESVKQIISDRTGIPVVQQRLIGNTRSLDSDDSLASCGIENESTLFLALYIIGGMPKKKQFRFCEAVLVHETYSPDDYDRSYNYDNASSYGGGSTYSSSSSYSGGSSGGSSSYSGGYSSYSGGSSGGYSSYSSYSGGSSGYSGGSSGGYSGSYSGSYSSYSSYSSGSSGSYKY
jgi:hypothetical protein